jgi:transposase
VGGEKVFVDFAGDMIDLLDPESGEVRLMKLFVAVIGASNYACAEAVASEAMNDRIGAHLRLFAVLGGMPKVVLAPLHVRAI